MSSKHPSQPHIAALGKELTEAKLDLWLQPMSDEFQGEYTPKNAARLPFLTGFTGSAGLGAFWAKGTKKHALFVDGRYTLQAAQQVDGPSIEVINSGDQSLDQWLNAQGKDELRIGFDPWLASQRQLEHWQKQVPSATWVAQSPNPIDAIWEDRPAAPVGEVMLHSLEFAGVDYATKREALTELLKEHKADALVLNLPDGINWLLNIRGSDISFNPLLLAYFVLYKNGSAILYAHERSFSDGVAEYFKKNKVEVKKLTDIFAGKEPDLSEGKKLLVDPTTSAHGWWRLAKKHKWELIAIEDPTLLPKACKNEVELSGVRRAHARDGLALSNFLAWFDGQILGGRLPDELTVMRVLEEHRAMDNAYRGASFATIAGSGPHGAIVHYRADEHSNRRAQMGELFLLDSGGQYDDGTTDVTRTLWVGTKEPHAIFKDHFTRVLKGHIALALARFPEGTSGAQLDALARMYLWQAGLDYDHGTGHGVGAYLCVHEGPQRIAKKGSAVALQEGMILSNEPGYYAEGNYGIRIENLVTVVKVGTTWQGKALLGFETLTLAPIDTRLVDVSMLNADERNWLNAYHQRVYKTHAAAMDERNRRWLAQATRAI